MVSAMTIIHKQNALSLSLNLLADIDKKRIKSDIALFVVRDMFFLFLFSVLIIAVLLVISKITLDEHYRDVVAATKLADSEHPLFQQRVLDLSSKSEHLLRIQASWQPVAPYIASVTEIIQKPTMVSSLVFNKQDSTIHLTGYAETRSAVLAVQKQLESLPFTATVESPLANILQSADIDFQFTIHIKNQKN